MWKKVLLSLLASDVLFAVSGSNRILMQAPQVPPPATTTLVPPSFTTKGPIVTNPQTTAGSPNPTDPATQMTTKSATTAAPQATTTAASVVTLIPNVPFIPTTTAVPVPPITTINVQTTSAAAQTTNAVTAKPATLPPQTTTNPVTAAPVLTTAAPVLTTAAPALTTAAPIITTAAPAVTDAVTTSKATTLAPAVPVTTKAATTLAPGVDTTAVPVPPVTTAAPVLTTTVVPIVTTAAPLTTAVPVVTTSSPATTALPVIPAVTTLAPVLPAVTTTAGPVLPAVTTTAIPAPMVPAVTTTAVPAPVPTEVQPPAGYWFGAHGQLCEATNNVLMSKCTDITQSASDGGNGHLFCNSFEGDCCLCDAIECGYDGRGCNQALFGYKSAFGVKDVRIRGAPRGLGAMVMCHGEESCRDSNIEGYNVDSVNCNGHRSCQGATMVITDPKSNFLLDCSGFSSCEDLEIEIKFSGPPPGYMCAVDADPTLVKDLFSISAIECENEAACKGMKLTINNEGCESVMVQDLRCLEYDSCSLAEFTFVGDVSLSQCRCGPSCAEASGLSQCFQNLDKVTCNDPQICMDQKRVITNPLNNFLFECGNIESCQRIDVRFDFTADVNRPRHITVFDGLVFGGVNAAMDGVFTFDNQQGLDHSVPEGIVPLPIVVTVKKVECSQDGSCENAVFVTGEHVLIQEVNCATDACYGCLIKEKVTDVGMPCDPEFFARPTPPPTSAVTPAPVAPVTPAPIIVTPSPVTPAPVLVTTVDPQYVTVPGNNLPAVSVVPVIPAVEKPATTQFVAV